MILASDRLLGRLGEGLKPDREFHCLDWLVIVISAPRLSSLSFLHKFMIAKSIAFLASLAGLIVLAISEGAIAQDASDQSLCPRPALSRVVRHTIAPGETLDSIAQAYGLLPATLMGLNPALRSGKAPVGQEILVPPYNGIRVVVPAGQTWRDVADTYGVRADALFEVNGCVASPTTIFVPGVNWSPNTPGAQYAAAPPTPQRYLTRYPLPSAAQVADVYGWRVHPVSNEVAFHSGVNLQAAAGTPVYAAGDGTVAFVGMRENYGNLVVINHQGGLQTRYGFLASMQVKTGQTVKAGDVVGAVGEGNLPSPSLDFEVRRNSDLGWVAEDPEPYLREMGRP